MLYSKYPVSPVGSSHASNCNQQKLSYSCQDTHLLLPDTKLSKHAHDVDCRLTAVGFLPPLAALLAHCARLLHSRTGWSSFGDTSGYSAFNAARVINPASMPAPATRTAVTPLSIAAEATSNAVFTGAHRMVAPKQRRAYATVEPDPVADNEQRRQVTIQPRQRLVQDLPAPRNTLAGGSGESACLLPCAACSVYSVFSSSLFACY
jgi:hypothetical protein